MKKETLKKLRILIPGLLLLIFSIPIFQDQFTFEEMKKIFDTFSKGIIYTIIVFGGGAIYYLANLRGLFLKESLYQIHQNIKIGIISLCDDDPKILSAFKKLMEGRTLILVFYGFLDKDKSLKEKAKNVYFNGLIWSSVADLTAISALSFIAYTIGWFWVSRAHYLVMIALSGALHLFCELVFMPSVTAKHIDLGSEQIEHIGIHSRDELKERLREIAFGK